MNPDQIDDDIRRQNWRGQLPLQISLCADDFSNIAAPEPAFCTVSRMTYLPVVARDVLPLLLEACGSGAPKISVNNCWVESERGDAVQWHLPVGAIYDALVPLTSQSLVLKLCIRCSACPADVMRLLDIDDAMKPQCVATSLPSPNLQHLRSPNLQHLPSLNLQHLPSSNRKAHRLSPSLTSTGTSWT